MKRFFAWIRQRLFGPPRRPLTREERRQARMLIWASVGGLRPRPGESVIRIDREPDSQDG